MLFHAPATASVDTVENMNDRTPHPPTQQDSETLRTSLINPTNLDEVREVFNLKSLVFHSPRLTKTDLDTYAESLSQDGFRTTVIHDTAAPNTPAVASFLSMDSMCSLPGGADVPTTAISDVVVLPTHKRQGILRRWMTNELHRAKNAGNVCAALHAAEWEIYGRYGFGMSAARTAWTLRPDRSHFLSQPSGHIRIITPHEAATIFTNIETAVRAAHPGTITAPLTCWKHHTDPTTYSPNTPARWFAAHTDNNGNIDGAVSYSFPDGWKMGRHENRMTIHELRASTPTAERELWRHCANTDFITEIDYALGHPDLPLPWYLSNPRAAQSGPIWDGLWTRILDVPAALNARTYPLPGEINLTITDPLHLTDGTYILTINTNGQATCHPTNTPNPQTPHLHIDINALASLWLGGGGGIPTLPDLILQDKAHLTQKRDLHRVATLFTWPNAPHDLTNF
ncbi:Enhanced intracellular survival protein [Dermatophilus congolensis]|uniref:Enhanced intracellular survival protein n=2 Tax=Dermatophilus congolensis TaxID=1863 RepID=A0AA46BL60_9MICO|nr:Enhanced intracellular survival protein [Dermatophilus congolensis]